jgi:hypothetical protein
MRRRLAQDSFLTVLGGRLVRPCRGSGAKRPRSQPSSRPNLIALVFDDDDDVDLDVHGVRVTAACATPPLPGGARC